MESELPDRNGRGWWLLGLFEAQLEPAGRAGWLKAAAAALPAPERPMCADGPRRHPRQGMVSLVLELVVVVVSDPM